MISQAPFGYPSQSPARGITAGGTAAFTVAASQRDGTARRIQLQLEFACGRRVRLGRRTQSGQGPLQLIRLGVADREVLELDVAASLHRRRRMRRGEPVDEKWKREAEALESRRNPLPVEPEPLGRDSAIVQHRR